MHAESKTTEYDSIDTPVPLAFDYKLSPVITMAIEKDVHPRPDTHRTTNLVHIHKLVVLYIRGIRKTRSTECLVVLVLSIRLVLGIHGSIVDGFGLASCDSLPLSLLVEEEEETDLDGDKADQGDEDHHDGKDTGGVSWCVLCFEKQGSDNVASGGSGVEESHDDGFLHTSACLSCRSPP